MEPVLRTLPSIEQITALHGNVVSYFTAIKKRELDGDEIKSVESLMEQLREIHLTDKSKFPSVDLAEMPKPPFKVRKIMVLHIAGNEHPVLLGRKMRVCAVARKAEVIAGGEYGDVYRSGLLLHSQKHLIMKVWKKEDAVQPTDLFAEMEVPRTMHLSGRQRGIQSAPHALYQFGKKWGYYVEGYETDLDNRKVACFSIEERKKYGFSTCEGLAKGALDLILGLHALHKSGIAHRDIKRNNIGIENGQWVLADFGLAIRNPDIKNKDFGGTPLYVLTKDVQQQLSAEKDPVKLADLYKKQDIFSLGCLFIEIFSQAITGQMSMIENKVHPLWFKELVEYVGYSHKPPDNYPKKYVDMPSLREILDLIGETMGVAFKKILRGMIKDHDERSSIEEIRERWEKAMEEMPNEIKERKLGYLNIPAKDLIAELKKRPNGTIVRAKHFIGTRIDSVVDIIYYTASKKNGGYKIKTRSWPEVCFRGLKTDEMPQDFFDEIFKQLKERNAQYFGLIKSMEELLPKVSPSTGLLAGQPVGKFFLKRKREGDPFHFSIEMLNTSYDVRCGALHGKVGCSVKNKSDGKSKFYEAYDMLGLFAALKLNPKLRVSN